MQVKSHYELTVIYEPPFIMKQGFLSIIEGTNSKFYFIFLKFWILLFQNWNISLEDSEVFVEKQLFNIIERRTTRFISLCRTMTDWIPWFSRQFGLFFVPLFLESLLTAVFFVFGLFVYKTIKSSYKKSMRLNSLP